MTQLKQIDELWEASSESEAEELITKAKKEFDVTQQSITYKHSKREQRDYWIVKIRKNMDPDVEE